MPAAWKSLKWVERNEPDPKRVEKGMAILGRMIAQALEKDAASGKTVAPQHQEESNDDVSQD